MPTIRPLAPADTDAYHAARLQMLREAPSAFLTDAEEFATRPLSAVADRLKPNPNNITFGAWDGPELVGLVTLVREDSPRSCHRAHIYGMGVLERAQGQGVGGALLRTAVAYARELPGVLSLHLDVMETQEGARRLYESLGFQVWGTEPNAMCVGGQLLQAHAMWLDLSTPSGKQA
ncbi:GNAT family N-acetyltransferase [Deinococcus radiophilus]|uniref:GNAT family N-acetyltransferase n=1 Tax=Deinococcus radiophilus TaxID=32062 RepID=A0A3S0I6C9_9DEIO|nr:GNAT family N-acetyltransferase [Deinococcus radiophilus]RTR25797.1 GNAT family N-acetyltransferase [Deinococcus radiophilus]UFA50842.1 GNAT family N-acetyltransferase [Deinococcus radiophilus]